MIRFPDVVVAQRQGVVSGKSNDTKALNQQLQLQPQQQHQVTAVHRTKSQSPSATSQPSKLHTNLPSKNKKKHHHAYQVSGRKRNANSSTGNSHSHSSGSSNSSSSTSSINSSNNGSDNNGRVNNLIANQSSSTNSNSNKTSHHHHQNCQQQQHHHQHGNKPNSNNNNVSYGASESYAYSNSAKKIVPEVSCGKSVSLDSISSSGADDSCTNKSTAAMNLHMANYLPSQHQSRTQSKSNAVPTSSSPLATTTPTAAATSKGTPSAAQKYTVDFLHSVGAQMTTIGSNYSSGMQKHDYSNRMRPSRIEYPTFNGGKSHSQYASNGNNDYGRHNNSKYSHTSHSKSHVNNASISPPLSVVSSGSSNHSGRGSNHSNNMNYRNSQTFGGMQSTHPSNHYPNNFYYPSSPYCGGANANSVNSMHPQHQQQQQQSNYGNSQHHHPPNQSNPKSIHQMPSPPIYHANNNYSTHNRNYQNGKKNWQSNYSRFKKNMNGNQYNSSNGNSNIINNNNNNINNNNSSNGSNSNASNGPKINANATKFIPNKNDFSQSSTNDRSRVDLSSNPSITNSSKLPSEATKSPSVSPSITPTENNGGGGGGGRSTTNIAATTTTTTTGTAMTASATTTTTTMTIPPSTPATVADAFTKQSAIMMTDTTSLESFNGLECFMKHTSISPPICISPSSVTNSTILQPDRLGFDTKNATIADRTMSSITSASSMDRKDVSAMGDGPQFHYNYSTSPTHPVFTEELFLRINNGLSSAAGTAASNTSNASSSSTSADSTGSAASMPMFSTHGNVILYDPHFMSYTDFYNIPASAMNGKANSTHDGQHQKRSYSGHSSPTPGTKAYRNSGTYRDRHFNMNHKPGYGKNGTKVAKQKSPYERFFQQLDSIELPHMGPDALCNDSVWDELSQNIWRKCVERQQTKETYRNKMLLWKNLIDKIEEIGRKEIENCPYSIYLVGSTISGFGLDTSDVDICLVSQGYWDEEPRSEAIKHLSPLRIHLLESPIYREFNLILAKVPILRFKDIMHKAEIDLNYNNCVGIRNTHLLHCYSRMDWRLRPLALIVKIWAQFHYINNAKDMTISSYSLILMVIHFLQCAVQPPVLPCLQAMYPEKFQRGIDINLIDINEDIEPYHSDNKQPLGELFLQFLEYYSNFNYEQNAISVRIAGLLPIEQCRLYPSFKNEAHAWTNLCIEEPFDFTNTARSCYDEKIFERIKTVFVRSWQVLRDTMDLSKLFDEPFLSPPSQLSFDNLPLAPTYHPLLAPFS